MLLYPNSLPASNAAVNLVDDRVTVAWHFVLCAITPSTRMFAIPVTDCWCDLILPQSQSTYKCSLDLVFCLRNVNNVGSSVTGLSFTAGKVKSGYCCQ